MYESWNLGKDDFQRFTLLATNISHIPWVGGMLYFDRKDPQTSRIFGSNLQGRESLPSFNKSGPQVFWMMSKTPLVLREKSFFWTCRGLSFKISVCVQKTS